MHITSIAVSEATDDYGTFELQFGGGFLAFEGAGAISKWYLEISKHAGIKPEDVILKIRYAAAKGGDNVKKVVESSLEGGTSAGEE